MNPRKIKLFLYCLVSVLVAVSAPSACSPSKYSGEPQPVVVAYSPFESTGLLWVAMDRGYFARNGLEVSLRRYPTGAASLDGMLEGLADIAFGVAEFPVVLRAMQNKPLAIVANTDKAEFVYLVGRRDRGILQPSDLKGKRIGLARGTIAEFYLGRFLELNGISRQNVVIVDLKTPDEWVNSVAGGDVDAVVTAQPDASKARDALSGNAVFWSMHMGQSLHSLVVASQGWLAEEADASARFLKALAQAEDWLFSNQEKAKTIVRDSLGLDVKYIDTAWAQNKYGLNLDQELILDMEDEARWAMGNNVAAAGKVPNFLDFIFSASLRSAREDAVSIAGK